MQEFALLHEKDLGLLEKVSSWEPDLQEQDCSAVTELTWHLLFSKVGKHTSFHVSNLCSPASCWTSQLDSEVFIPLFSLQISQIFSMHTALDENILTKHHHLYGRLVLLPWSVRACGVDWRQLLTWTAEVCSMAWCSISLSTCTASSDLHQQQAATKFWTALN